MVVQLWIVVLAILILAFRIVQRLYFMISGHKHCKSTFSPRYELEDLLIAYRVLRQDFQINSSIDRVPIRYRKLGKGKSVYLLANGVGTDIFVFFDVFRILLSLDPQLFEKITLLVPSYRGLFEHTEDNLPVNITIANCAQDIEDVLQSQGIKTLDGFIGWSTGAQIGLHLLLKHPNFTKAYFLLNPSLGKTLHTALQPFLAAPAFLGRLLSYIMHNLITYLITLVPTLVWDRLKEFNDSVYFYYVFVMLAFLAGFPPDQPVYFYEYMKDAFRTRRQTQHLLELILSLDDDTVNANRDDTVKAFQQITQPPFVILSGIPDFLTGIYHTRQLNHLLTNNGQSAVKIKHVSFTMGSHYLLIEWPELVAKEMLLFFLQQCSS